MALQFIIGRSGTGKSNMILGQIREKLKEEPIGCPLILLAPEQGTFQLERGIVQDPHIHGTVRAQVLGFRRLALRVMQETGGSALVPISDEGKKMLLYKIMRRRKEELKLYGTGSDQLGLIDRINTLYTEMKKHNTNFSTLDEHLQLLESSDRESPLLKDKLHDLSLIYSQFDEELSKLYIDAEDHVIKLAEGIPQCEYLEGAEIWIDGFHSFTPQEYTVLGALLQKVSNVTVALTLDRTYDEGIPPHELNLFHPTAMTYLKLKNLADNLHIEVKPTKVIAERPFMRFKRSETLAHLELAYEHRTPWKLSAPPSDMDQALALYVAGNRRNEIDAVAREMLRLARDKGSRWRDMALFVRNLDDYEHMLTPIFQDYGIPFFMDQKRDVLHHPLIEMIRGALDVVQKFWKYDDVFRCVKSGFLLPIEGHLSREDMDMFENYVLACGIQGYRWRDERPWSHVPSLSLEVDDEKHEDKKVELLQSIEKCREVVIRPMGTFEDDIKKATTAREMCEAVYHLLENIEAPQRLDLLAHEAVQHGRPQQAMEHRQLWGAILSLLDQIVEMMGEEIISRELFSGILDTGLKALQLSLVPPSIDQVLIGSIDRTRIRDVKHLFLLGINEGIMPANLQEEGVLSDQERQRLSEIGLELAPPITRKLLDERFLIYGAISAASDSLWLSYPSSDEEGKSLLPSEVIRHVRTIFPSHLKELSVRDMPNANDGTQIQLDYVNSPAPTLSRLISQLRLWKSGQEISQVWWSALKWYKNQPEWEGRVKSLLGSLNYRNQVQGLTPMTSRKLYGKKLRTSVSRMERFSACPFSHFASHGLKLKERQMYRLKAPDIGQLFHAALSQMAMTFKEQNRSWGSLTTEECLQEASVAVDKLAPKLQGEILLSSHRYGYISRKLKNIVGRASVILGEQSRRGSFEPVGLELDFGPGRLLPSLTFELPNGCVMEIVGRIDRVDMAQGENGILLRVIDYKSSQTDLKLHEVYFGLSLQMLTYLDVLLSSAEMWLGQPALPAGTLYFHVHNPLLQSSNGMTLEQAQLEMLKRFKMKGLLLADRDVISKMDEKLEKGYSDILPVAVKADGGFYSSASVATSEQWDTLLSSVRHVISEIGTRITEGDIEIAPYRLGTETACTHCAYKPVCRFDETVDGSNYHLLSKPGKDKLWELLQSKGERGGA